MNNINITVNLSEVDRQRLDTIIGYLGLLTPISAPTESTPEPVADPAPAVKTPEPAVEPEPKTEPTPEPVADSAPDVKPVSLAEFQKAVTLAVSKSADAKKKAKEIINEYATSVSAVPEDKRAEVIAKLATI